ncbi:hypothetical protein HK405_012489, partial [Cladochytrium tenue]
MPQDHGQIVATTLPPAPPPPSPPSLPPRPPGSHLRSFVVSYFQISSFVSQSVLVLLAAISAALLVTRLLLPAVTAAPDVPGAPFKQDALVFSMVLFHQAKNHEGAVLYGTSPTRPFLLAGNAVTTVASGAAAASLWLLNRQIDYTAVAATLCTLNQLSVPWTFFNLRAAPRKPTRLQAAVAAVVISIGSTVIMAALFLLLIWILQLGAALASNPSPEIQWREFFLSAAAVWVCQPLLLATVLWLSRRFLLLRKRGHGEVLEEEAHKALYRQCEHNFVTVFFFFLPSRIIVWIQPRFEYFVAAEFLSSWLQSLLRLALAWSSRRQLLLALAAITGDSEPNSGSSVAASAHSNESLLRGNDKRGLAASAADLVELVTSTFS